MWVCNVPDYATVEVAMHAAAMLLALMRNLAGHDREVRAGRWNYQLGGPLRRPSSLTLGVIGLGRIGRLTAQRAGPWFGTVVGCDPYLPDDAWPNGIQRLDLAELFARSSIVTLHLPLTDATRGLVGADLIERMPAGSYLVNTSGVVSSTLMRFSQPWKLVSLPASLSTCCPRSRRRMAIRCSPIHAR